MTAEFLPAMYHALVTCKHLVNEPIYIYKKAVELPLNRFYHELLGDRVSILPNSELSEGALEEPLTDANVRTTKRSLLLTKLFRVSMWDYRHLPHEGDQIREISDVLKRWAMRDGTWNQQHFRQCRRAGGTSFATPPYPHTKSQTKSRTRKTVNDKGHSKPHGGTGTTCAVVQLRVKTTRLSATITNRTLCLAKLNSGSTEKKGMVQTEGM